IHEDTTVNETTQELDICAGNDIYLPDGIRATQPGIYKTILKTQLTGCDSIIVTTLKVMPNNFYIPNAFLPDGNGLNDFFTIFTNTACIPTIRLREIYDRWGELLFQKKNFPANIENEGWNGFYNGKQMLPGVYTWRLELDLPGGQILTQTGDVTLIR
ncbi:MAG: gliding motility-associated C-terminal domain-containing protein, partial [Saprospiraceae bacterium]|nr:gliding motility-associated C-terminal domain-containing protein [Saprospiraceae bacterium]